MPMPGARFRFRTLPDGSKQRLAFKGKKVVEVKPYSASGTPTGEAKKVDGKKRRRPLRLRKG